MGRPNFQRCFTKKTGLGGEKKEKRRNVVREKALILGDTFFN